MVNTPHFRIGRWIPRECENLPFEVPCRMVPVAIAAGRYQLQYVSPEVSNPGIGGVRGFPIVIFGEGDVGSGRCRADLDILGPVHACRAKQPCGEAQVDEHIRL